MNVLIKSQHRLVIIPILGKKNKNSKKKVKEKIMLTKNPDASDLWLKKKKKKKVYKVPVQWLSKINTVPSNSTLIVTLASNG